MLLEHNRWHALIIFIFNLRITFTLPQATQTNFEQSHFHTSLLICPPPSKWTRSCASNAKCINSIRKYIAKAGNDAQCHASLPLMVAASELRSDNGFNLPSARPVVRMLRMFQEDAEGAVRVARAAFAPRDAALGGHRGAGPGAVGCGLGLGGAAIWCGVRRADERFRAWDSLICYRLCCRCGGIPLGDRHQILPNSNIQLWHLPYIEQAL